jgi:hypothetical protein
VIATLIVRWGSAIDQCIAVETIWYSENCQNSIFVEVKLQRVFFARCSSRRIFLWLIFFGGKIMEIGNALIQCAKGVIVRRFVRASLASAIALSSVAPQYASAQSAPICLNPPPINGAPSTGAAPVGWAVAVNTPDIVNGNGPWPGGGYTISDVSGTSTSGGTMGLFLNEGVGYQESWQTTLTGLTIGQTYQIAIEWQQGTLSQNGGGDTWSGGSLRMSVDGNVTDYAPVGTAASDVWQVATITFVATGTSAVFVLGATPGPGSNMVVADSGAACSIVVPTQAAGPVPALPLAGLGALGAALALIGGFVMRSRRREIK